MRIGRNRKELINKIINNAQDIGFYNDDDMYSKQGKFENQEEGKKIMKDNLNQFDFAYLHCDEQGKCGVHVTSNSFYNFQIDPQIIGQEIIHEKEKRGKRQQKSQEHQSKLHELGISKLPKGMSFDQVKEKFEQQNKKREELKKEIQQEKDKIIMKKGDFCKKQFGIKNSYPDEFYPKEELEKGIRIEMEHVEPINKEEKTSIEHYIDAVGLATCIAKNHLDEQRDDGKEMNYYELLGEMEKKFINKK
ncbi:MAG: hypothetical protein WC934_04855 [Acidithiobacillus sp.]|jgi:hypothetical protein|uniref:hypothetical protein n=1 Tax=Acidithiobacillus sp. TaxID=1872118 RepID=UPI00355CDC5F